MRFISWTIGTLILIAMITSSPADPAVPPPETREGLFARGNLIAWCIVPFDSKKRGPEERARMLEKLGFKHFAYDWRAEHIPTFDAEIEALKKHGVALDAFWVAPGELNTESRLILGALKRNQVRAQLWALLDLGADKVTGAEQTRRVEVASSKLKTLADEAKLIGCDVVLYNHGGWFGEPENQVAIIEHLKTMGVMNVGIVYNLHHGHDHLDRFPALLAKMKPYLRSLNLNGMEKDGDKHDRKILPLGQGALDLEILRTIRDSGYRGPIGILGHTDDDAEERLQDNLDGLDWLLPQLDGKPAGPKPKPRTIVPDPVGKLVAEARSTGDSKRGAEVFSAAKYACLNCHKVGEQGGVVGPDLTAVGRCVSPEEIAESVLWPAQKIKEGYVAKVVATTDGRSIQGYLLHETAKEVGLRDPQTGKPIQLARADIEEIRDQGTLMPSGLAEAMTPMERRDLVRFLMDLGRVGDVDATLLVSQIHQPATFLYERAPLNPEHWPNWQLPVNRDRVYDYYIKEAEHFTRQTKVPALLPAFPGMDGGREGHWGNQNDTVWTDDRWNQTELGSLLSGVFRGAGVTVPKGVCIRLGDRGELSTCFNPETLCYEAVWDGGFVKFTNVRHGFMDGLVLDGTPRVRPEGTKPTQPFTYHGFYRHGKRVIFAYRLGETEMLDAPWVENGQFTRLVGPATTHPLADLTHGGAPQWPQSIATQGSIGKTRPYAVDTIVPPFENPWKAMMFFGDHDFQADGSAMLSTMQGDVWHVDGLDETLKSVRWRRFAAGLHQALGVIVADGKTYVLGRDQITRLHDLNNDGEADFYECVSNIYDTSPGGHDFVCGLQRDPVGNFYTASSKQGVLKISADGKKVDVLATGFRNPDGLGLSPDGVLTVPSSEGEWVCASMVAEIKTGGHYGYGGPKNGQAPDLPLVYLPRGLDNSSGSQVTVTSDRWGPLKGQLIHFSFGSGTHFLLLREQVGGQPQGAVVPLPGDFNSGVHRGRFNPKDGQLYVSGMAGWGTYTPADGCFQRVRYTGDPVQLPIATHAHENGMLISFTQPIDRAVAQNAKNQFAQCWNYRYSSAYGSQELSPRHPGTPGHDPLTIRSAHVLADGRTLFLEIPDLQPVNQLQLHLRVDVQSPIDLFATVHKLAPPFTGFPGYQPTTKTIAAHPILSDLSLATKSVPNPWRAKIAGARSIAIEAGTNLSFSLKSFDVSAGEPIKLTFTNPDAVPHNWALIKPGALARVGELANKIIADPDAAARQYLPKSDDLLVATDIVNPQDQFTIFFLAPKEPGRYPFLCTFPGHWMVMNGVMNVR